MKVYNTDGLKEQENFIKALLCGLLVSFVLGFIYGSIYYYNDIPIFFSYIYFIFGQIIGKVIQKSGRGVSIQFSILGALLVLFCIIISIIILLIGPLGIFDLNLLSWVIVYLPNYIISSFSNLIYMSAIWIAVITGYSNSTIV